MQIIAYIPASAGILFDDSKFHKVIYLPEGCGSADFGKRNIFFSRKSTCKTALSCIKQPVYDFTLPLR